MESTNLDNYKAVIVLNNSGIALLQRGRYEDALATFKDATDLMSCIRDDRRRCLGEEKKALYLQHVSKRMAETTKVAGDEELATNSHFSLCVLYQGETNYTREILATFPESLHAFVYILVYDEATSNIIIDTSTLLYNFSVAIRMKVLLHQQGERHSCCIHCKLMLFANNVATAANTILSEYINTSFNGRDNEQENMQEQSGNEETFQLAYVSVLNLITLTQAIYHKRTNLTRNYYSQLPQMRALLLDAHDSALNKLSHERKITARAA